MVPWLVLAWLVACLSWVAWDDSVKAPPRTKKSEDGTLPGWDKPLTKQAIESVKKATVAAARLDARAKGAVLTDEGRAEYLSLRRAVAASAPFFRLRAQLGSEVLLGPPTSMDEGGGALALLDRALVDKDSAQAKKQLDQVVRALRLIDNEIALHGVPPDDAVQALSDAAFLLGLMLLEAYPGVPDGPDAVLADVRGTLDAIAAGGQAAVSMAAPADRALAEQGLQALRVRLAPLEEAVSHVSHAHQLSDRASLLKNSGLVGVAARRLARTLGARVRLPYQARTPVADNGIEEPITALTLPAPRRDLRSGDRTAMAALGRALFFDKRLSRGSIRACSNCHVPAKGYADGLVTPPSLDPKTPLYRNTPTLLYAPLHAAQLWDGQFASAERQALNVIHTAAEMGLDADELTRAVKGDAALSQRFGEIFDDGVTAANVARALVAFEVAELVPGTAPVDRFAHGDDASLDDEMRRGLDVFAGIGRCARCHVPPLYGGSRPTDFAVPIYAALGVPTTPGGKELDADEGRTKHSKKPLDRFAFKTPTVRNVAVTAPFFHHGRFPTLESVVDFYDKGGGKGAGISLDNQDPEVRKLDLTKPQKDALMVFMRVALHDAP